MDFTKYFALPQPNTPLKLSEEPASIRLGRESLQGTASAVIRALPRPRVTLDVEVSSYFGLDISKKVEVTLASSPKPLPCAVANGKLFSETPSTIRLRPLEEVSRGALDMPVSEIIFSVPNFPEFLGHGVIETLPLGGWRRVDELRLTISDWRVTIRNTPDINEQKIALSENGGFGITAVGIMERSDHHTFTWEEAAPQLETLRVFLSFACGRWTGPMLPIGLDENGARIWERWSVPRLLDDAFIVMTWFDVHHGATLSDIMPGFLVKWSDALWKETISYAIYWFVRANSPRAGADASLILSQAALEMLSWTYLVKSTSTISRSQFKKQNAETNIRTLLAALGIPVVIPSSLSELDAEAARRGWCDGVQAITSIRNDLVHPEKGAPAPVTEAWVLGQRFLELVLLRLFDFHGEHANRTIETRWVGTVERVPWT